MKSIEFQQLFERIAPEVYRLALGILDNPEDAEDAVQDAFMRVLEVRESFRGEAKLSTWIFRIVANTCHSRNLRPDRVRNKKVSLEAALGLRDDSLERWELPSVKSEADFLREFVSTLPRRQAKAITLYYFHSFDYNQVARAMGVSVQAVTSLLCRGRGQLQFLVERKRKELAR